MICPINRKKNEIPKERLKRQKWFDWYVHWWYWKGKCKLPFKTRSTGRIQQFNMKMLKFLITKHSQMCFYGGYHGTFSVTSSWKTANGPKVKENVCSKPEDMTELNKMEFGKGLRGYEACVLQLIRQKTNLESRHHIRRVILQYSISFICLSVLSLLMLISP
jgi:hypothetical protein